MNKHIVFYTSFNSWSAEAFLDKINEYEPGEDLSVRSNSPGGSVLAGWGMCSAIAEHEGNTLLKVDGLAASMTFFWAMFFDKVECLDVSSWMVHRASAPSWADEETHQQVEVINGHLKAKMKQRFNAATFKSVTGHSIDDIFKADGPNVWITAKQAKQIGLVSKINKLKPAEAQALARIAAITVDFDEITAEAIDVDREKDKSREKEALESWPFASMSNHINI